MLYLSNNCKYKETFWGRIMVSPPSYIPPRIPSEFPEFQHFSLVDSSYGLRFNRCYYGRVLLGRGNRRTGRNIQCCYPIFVVLDLINSPIQTKWWCLYKGNMTKPNEFTNWSEYYYHHKWLKGYKFRKSCLPSLHLYTPRLCINIFLFYGCRDNQFRRKN